MTTIAIDIDDTLVPFGDRVREEFFKLAIETGDKKYLRGAYADFNEWRDLSDLFLWPTVLEVINRVHEKQWAHLPYPGASRVLRRLAKKYKIKYVTAREKRWEEHVRTFLFGDNFPEGELVLLDPSVHDKSDALEDCKYLIEDRPKTIIQFLHQPYWYKNWMEVNPNKLVFGLWKNHNRNLTDIDRVYLAPTWKGIEYYMEKKGVL